MEANAYNKHIRDQIEAINHKYVRDMERKGYMLSDMDITPNVAVREGEGILSSGLSLLGLGAAPKVARARGEGIMGEGLLDDIGRGFSTGFMMPFKLLGLGKKGKKAGAVSGGRRGRPRKMAGAVSGGEIGLNLREQNPNYLKSKAMMEGAGILSSVLGAVGLGQVGGASTGGAVSGGKRGRKSKAMKEGEGILSGLLGAVGLGKEAGAMSGGMRRKLTTIPYNVSGGAVTVRKRGRKSKAMKEGEGILSGLLGAVGLGKEAGAMSGGMRRKLTTIPYNVSGGAVTVRKRGRKSKAMKEGEGILSGLLGTIGLGKEGGAVSGGAVSGGRMHRKRGGIQTGGIQTGGLARAVGSGMGELEGSGFFDDVLDKISSVASTVKKGVDIGKDLGLLKGKGRKRAGASTGGAVSGGASPWIQHIKAYQKKHGVSYKEAMKKAKATYKKKN